MAILHSHVSSIDVMLEFALVYRIGEGSFSKALKMETLDMQLDINILVN